MKRTGIKRTLAAASALFLLFAARAALAISQPPPGTDPALHGAEPAGYGKTIGIVVAIVVAIATGIWWYLSHAQGDRPRR